MGVDAGIGREDVDPSPAVDRRPRQRVQVGAHGDVGGERKRVAAVGVELGGARRGGVAVDIGQHDVCALRPEHAGDPSADPPGRAGHDRHLSVESLHPGWGSACQPVPMWTVGSVVVAASALILKIGDL